MNLNQQNLDDLARATFAYVASDGVGYRRAARVLQSLWRERSNLPMGEHKGHPLGSRLPIEIAERDLVNYLTPGIRQVVREELATASDSQLFAKPRIYNDLLSSQPLCFNLFGELKLDLGFATSVMRALRPAIKAVTRIGFEYSPGRSDERFTGDRSAFDVYVEYEASTGCRGFIGIEVKYHENLKEPAAPHRPRYDEVAAKMDCFYDASLPQLHKAPLQQFWRDHLLAGSMMCDDELDFSEGAFVVMYPRGNTYCQSAVQAYRACLSNPASFDVWTLEDFVGTLMRTTTQPWVDELRRRYLEYNCLAEESFLVCGEQDEQTTTDRCIAR